MICQLALSHEKEQADNEIDKETNLWYKLITFMPSPERSNPATELLKQAAANYRLEKAQGRTARKLSEKLQQEIDAGQIAQFGMNKNTPAHKQQQPPHSSR